jgi:Yip1-like protein
MSINYKAIMNRVIELMTNPEKTWRTIRDEPDHGRDLILGYVLLLASIPTVFGFLGNLLFGEGFGYALIHSILLLGVFVGSVFALGLLVNSMAPSFGTVRNENAAFKLVAYASTPVWVAGFLTLVPQLSLLAMLCGFGYSAYLFMSGCQVLMRTPAEKALKFSIASIGTWFAMVLITAMVVSRIAALLFAPSIMLDRLPSSPIKPGRY